MSQQNVELVCRIYERSGRRDFRAGTELYDNQQATGAGTGARVEMRYYQVWTFRGASVIRIESIRGRGEALQAAGATR
jgi:hypothetical protein